MTGQVTSRPRSGTKTREAEVALRVAAVPLALQLVREEVVKPCPVEHIARQDLARASSFQLESPEAVHRPDVEATHSGHRRRPRQPLSRGSKIPAAGRDNPLRHLDRVPPIELSNPPSQSIRVHCRGRYRPR